MQMSGELLKPCFMLDSVICHLFDWQSVVLNELFTSSETSRRPALWQMIRQQWSCTNIFVTFSACPPPVCCFTLPCT